MANIYNEKAWLRYSKMPYPQEKAAKISDIQANLDFLDKKLELAQKQLTMFDFYRIVDSVENSNDFQSKVDQLTPNSGLVVSEPFSTSAGSFGRGDIIYKYENGTTITIKAERAGIYYPSAIKFDSDNNIYNIIYQYSDSEPTKLASKEEGDFAKQMSFKINSPEQAASVYGLSFIRSEATGLSVNFKAVTVDMTIIYPIIKSFDINNEEVYWDYKLNLTTTDEGTNYTIENIPTIVQYIIVK